MSRRQISNLTFRSALQADRQQVPTGFLACRELVRVNVRLGKRPLTLSTGAYDRAAIMLAARSAADLHQRRYGSSRSEAMSVALKATWALAKEGRRSAAH